MTLHPRPAMVGILATLVTLVCALPAQATVIDRERYSGTNSGHAVECGVEVLVEEEWSGFFQLRAGTGKDASAFFGLDNYPSSAVGGHTRVISASDLAL